MKKIIDCLCAGLLAVLLLPGFLPSVASAAPLSQAEDLKAKADSLLLQGDTLYDQGDYQAAIDPYQQALLLYQKIGDRAGEGKALTKIGIAYYLLKQYESALDYFQQALPIRREIGDQAEEASTLSNLARTYESLRQYQQALDYYEQSLAVRQEIGDRAGEASTLSNLGRIYLNSGQYQPALEYFQQVLTIRQELGDRAGEGSARSNLAAAYRNAGLYAEALDHFREALVISQEAGERKTEGIILNNLGVVHDNLGQYSQALDHLQRSLAIAQEIDDRAGEGSALNNIGEVYRSLGQYAQALDSFEQSLAIRQEVGDQPGEEATLANMGSVYLSLGKYPPALDHYQRALTVAQEIGDRVGQGTLLNNFGAVYFKLGQYERALDYYLQSLEISREIGDLPGAAPTLNNIGDIYSVLDQHTEALDYFQAALSIAQETGDRQGEVVALNNLGLTYSRLGQYEQALDYYQQASSLAQEIGDRAAQGSAFNNIGRVYYELGDYSPALESFRQSLTVRQEIGDRPGEGATLSNMGLLYQEQGDKPQAITHYQQTIDIMESIQGEIKVEELKSSFAAGRAWIYEYLINLLWDEGRFEEALRYAERARARAFLDQLAGGVIDFRAGIEADLLGREQDLRNEIAAIRDQLVDLRNRPQSDWDTDAIAAAQAELTRHEADYARLLTEIKLQSPEVAGLVSVDVTSLSDIQSLLDPDTTLVEYFVMDERTLAFVITKDSFETAAVDVNREDLNQAIQDFRDFPSLDDAHPASLKQLHGWLIAPIKDKLQTPVLGVVPHGVLHYLPFAALTEAERYLGEEYSLFTLPSASALRFIQEKRKPQADKILALGDPAVDEPGLPSLNFAQKEAEDIAALFEAQPLTGASATESALRSQAGAAGIVHLAAHGQYNAVNPLFSVIYLAADAQQDGRLEVNEIYGLDLTRSTDLVVLSACETQVGQVSSGDEVVGMTRAFLYAGTSTVIGSLWQVDDQATTLLMERFYRHLREGMGKSQALQAAQDEVRAQYPHPYYWAAFVLTGDPGSFLEGNAGQPASKDSGPWWILGMVGILLIVLISGMAILRKQRKGTTP